MDEFNNNQNNLGEEQESRSAAPDENREPANEVNPQYENRDDEQQPGLQSDTSPASDLQSDASPAPAQPQQGNNASPDYNYGYAWNGNSAPKKKGGGIKALAIVMSIIAVLALSAVGVLIAHRFGDRYLPASQQNSTVTSDKTADPEDGAVSGNKETDSPVVTVPKGDDDDRELTKQEIIANAKPSVVGITAELQGGTVGGTGFVYAEEGYIITNYHVVSGAEKIVVTTSENEELDAQLVGGDSLSDVAVLKIEAGKLKALTMGDSDDIVEGDEVIAIGTPAGLNFAGTCTHGIISAVNRNIQITDSYGKVKKNLTVIQTDAAINSGNSGGPLLNSKGQVIGVNSLKLAGNYENMSFALPINGVVEITSQLISNGEVTERPEGSFASGTPAIGVVVMSVSEADAKNYGWPQGAYVYSLDIGGAAEKAGIKRGDIITAFDGSDVTNNQDLVSLIANKKVGDTVNVKVFRDSEYIELTVTLQESKG
ncbi:MAG: trypsin-like peptidase domain-containing protein [Firmicutes bacterium]|nr:trypsin-like peptidase domain-containing protein [Bacillota bacterium]